MTDESNLYVKLGREFVHHRAVEHGIGEYVRDDAHTNTIEGSFSIFKRGFNGIYQHCGEQHLYRYNNRIAFGVDDAQRADIALFGIVGKRLTYRWING